jgi:drug/metabolite transporter (DMT)-like permease
MSIQKFLPAGVARGIVTIVATVFAMALADAIVKSASADVSLWQIWVLRALVVIPLFAVMARKHLVPTPFVWVLLRSISLVLMYLGIYAALPMLDLSVVAAALYTSPLFITLLSAIVLREPIRTRHWLAIAIGFAGVLLIVRPDATSFQPLALIPIAAAFLYAVAAVITRARCADVPAQTMALWLNVALLVGGIAASLLVRAVGENAAAPYAFIASDWRPMSAETFWVVIALSALMIGIGTGLAQAYKSPKPHIIATFDYSFLIFAAFWGYVFFHEVPDAYTIYGMALIAVAGLVVLIVPNSAKTD